MRPIVQPYVPEDFRVRPFLSYTDLRRAIRSRSSGSWSRTSSRFGLGSVRGVSGVDVSGGSDPEIRVILDKEKLKTYDIQPYQVNAAIGTRLGTYPAGRVQQGEPGISLQVHGHRDRA